MKYTTEQTDMIAMISVVLKKIPYCYSEDSAEWIVSKDEVVSVDFNKKEIQFLNWSYTDDITYLQLLGVCQMYNFQSEDYIRK